MKNLTALLFCLALAACGGDTVTSNSGTTTDTTTDTTQPPATSTTAVPLSDANINITTDYGNYLIQAASGVNVTVAQSNNYNTVEFPQDLAAGVIDVGGNYNTLIFRAGTSVSKLTVTGNYNNLWVPSGSGITITGIPGTYTDFYTYTPTP